MKYVTPAEQYDLRRFVPPSQRQHHVEPVSSPLYVVTMISNPDRYYARYKLYQAFERMVADAGAVLVTVELALRDRHFEITSHNNPYHLQLRSPSVIWHKENCLNLGFQHVLRLHGDAEYFAWIDADVQFARPDWATETVHQLQYHRVVQMWSHSIDLGPDFQPIATCKSFLRTYADSGSMLKPLSNSEMEKSDEFKLGRYGAKGLHTGYAWAARRSALSDLQGLGDIGILGSGDRHMAYALVGQVAASMDQRLQPSYLSYWERWQERAERSIQRKVGAVAGTILHYWHGRKKLRRYQDRWTILVDDRYDWPADLKYDIQGVLELTDHNLKLRDDVRGYFAVRNEDSIDL